MKTNFIGTVRSIQKIALVVAAGCCFISSQLTFAHQLLPIENKSKNKIKKMHPKPSPDEPRVIDITDAIFTKTKPDCAAYAYNFVSNVMDIQENVFQDGNVLIEANDESCSLTSNSIPNHNFNDETANFGSPANEVEQAVSIPRFPVLADEPSRLSQGSFEAIMLNGVPVSILSAGCYDPTSPIAADDGNVNVGCRDDHPWLLDPLSTERKFGADLNNGHVQPGGLYHYHGGPEAMYDDNPGRRGSPVVGFAADGFPIYGGYFFDRKIGRVPKAISGYTLKEGERPVGPQNPPGVYTGVYRADWQFTDAGDLDECNGMTVNGQYGYYITDTFPWVMACISGTPDESFSRGGGGGGPGGPGGGGPGGEPPADDVEPPADAEPPIVEDLVVAE